MLRDGDGVTASWIGDASHGDNQPTPHSIHVPQDTQAAEMSDLLLQEIATLSHSIVVKVGTRVVTHPNGTLNETRIAQLAEELAATMPAGPEWVVHFTNSGAEAIDLAMVMVLVVALGRAFAFFGKVQKQYQKLVQDQ